MHRCRSQWSWFAFVLAGATNLDFACLPELFPTRLRASGVGVGTAASRIGSRTLVGNTAEVLAAYRARLAVSTSLAQGQLEHRSIFTSADGLIVAPTHTDLFEAD